MKIFVSVGTQKFQFDRLLMMVDKWEEKSDDVHEIFAQKGNSDYTPKWYKSTDFLDPESFLEYIKEADLIITHGGVGTIIKAIQNNKTTIVVPRLKKYSEHVDDHQLQITEPFSEEGHILLFNDGDDFNKIYKKSLTFKPKKYVSNRDNFIKNLKKEIDR